MEKEKISKELLNGVELCSHQLKLIKSQLTTYLSGSMKRKEATESNTNDRHSRKKMAKYQDSVSGTDSDDAPMDKKKNRDPEDSQSSAHSYSDVSSKNKDDNYKPQYYHREKTIKSKLIGKTKKGRGRPKKIVSSHGDSVTESIHKPGAARGRGRPPGKTPKKSHVERSQSPEESSVQQEDDESHNKEEESQGSKKGRGRPKKSLVETEKRGRGRPKNAESSSESGPHMEDDKPSLKTGRHRKALDSSVEDNLEGDKDREMPPSEVKKGRGRPKSVFTDANKSVTESSNEDGIKSKSGKPSTRNSVEPQTGAKKGRGRPKKNTSTLNGDDEVADDQAVDDAAVDGVADADEQ